MVKLKLADEISVSLNHELKCNPINGIIPEENIVLKAARILKECCEVPKNVGASITIKKNIPIGAGLGGGSADAATTLKLLVRLWKIDISDKELSQIAKKIGVDVVFCMQDSNAFVEGIGEKLTPMTLNKKIPILLVNPKFPVSTIEVYKRSVENFTQPISSNSEDITNAIYHGKNDLEIPAKSINSKITHVLNLIKDQEGCRLARMSGSGATCFGIFQTAEQAKKAYKNIKANSDYWLYFENVSI